MCTYTCVVYLFYRGFMVSWMLTYICVYCRVDTKPTSSSSRWTRKTVFRFSDLLTKTYLLTYKSYVLTHDVIGSGVAFFGRERNVYITQWNYIFEMTDTIKNILNDRRTIVTQFGRRLTDIMLLSRNILPVYIIMQILYPRLSFYPQKAIKMYLCIVETSILYCWGHHRLCLYKSITYVCDIKSK